MSRCDDDCFCCYKSEARSTGGEGQREPETPERACYDERFVWIYINTKVRDRYT